ncbi:ABC transporter ATP-binding protein [Aceticella autotrophica]|uniref:ABC transporter ATP-binding protein n=1 Tax=Aceticella autotrophica TaxID=2755338 RepID=A0A974Y2K1_9THEO|nr:ABC transporter ATP-binding protein [Aceticella autotrophica]QSZ26428.1 ABC transporter ATP-binding protein [Aceticella autotrophica]
MINLYNISKIYYGCDKKAVDSLNLEVYKGEIFGFLGPNGSGKTTTVKIITGILKPDSGKVLINGYDILKDPLKAKKEIGYVPDDPEIFNKLTGFEYLRFISDIYEINNKTRQLNIEKFGGILEINDVLNMKIESYSHGMKQKLLILGALIHEPSILIMDEPIIGLDAKAIRNLKNIMRTLADQGKTVFITTHLIKMAEDICDRIAIIKGGRIIYSGTVNELKIKKDNKKDLEEIFLEMTEA